MRKGKIEYYACGYISEYDLDDPKESSKFYEEIKEASSAIDSTEFGFFEQEIYEVRYYDSVAQIEVIKYVYAYSSAEAKVLAYLDSVYKDEEFDIKKYTASVFLMKDIKGRDEIIGDMDKNKYRDMVYEAEQEGYKRWNSL